MSVPPCLASWRKKEGNRFLFHDYYPPLGFPSSASNGNRKEIILAHLKAPKAAILPTQSTWKFAADIMTFGNHAAIEAEGPPVSHFCNLHCVVSPEDGSLERYPGESSSGS